METTQAPNAIAKVSDNLLFYQNSEARPQAALVTAVNDDHTVNLAVYDYTGHAGVKRDVVVLSRTPEKPIITCFALRPQPATDIGTVQELVDENLSVSDILHEMRQDMREMQCEITRLKKVLITEQTKADVPKPDSEVQGDPPTPDYLQPEE